MYGMCMRVSEYIGIEIGMRGAEVISEVCTSVSRVGGRGVFRLPCINYSKMRM